MEYILTHRKTPVAEIDCVETGYIRKVGKVFAPEHLPVGVGIKNGTVDRASLNNWWAERSIPVERSGVEKAVVSLRIPDTKALLLRSYGLSLSDQYWMNPVGSGLEWEKVNFFQNDFSKDIGDVLFGREKTGKIDFRSPDSTSDGNLQKRWVIFNGKRCLMKGGSYPFQQQPQNEVIATQIMQRLGIPCVPYSLTWQNGIPYSVCEDFIDENTELVPAWRILQTQKKLNNESIYSFFVRCAENLGIPNVVPFLDGMITLDYLIANEDRHFNNFGAVRNAKTLQWLGMAPIYDSGSSLGYDKTANQMRDENKVICKPFKNHHAEQLSLVSSFDGLALEKTGDIKQFVFDGFSDEKWKDFTDEKRVEAIADGLEKRLETIKNFSLRKVDETKKLSTADDVEKDIRKSY